MRCRSRSRRHNYGNYRRSVRDDYFLCDNDGDKDGIAKGIPGLIRHAPETGVRARLTRSDEADGDLIVSAYVDGSADLDIPTSHAGASHKGKEISGRPGARAGVPESPGFGE